ncbi:MAG: uracil phosphoribosyltransferase [Lysobacterales bacterium]|nr:MAG: uracil phosphoribosyltransferase [Xanthomonadales bacterium]
MPDSTLSGGPFARDPQHENLIVTRHPLLEHKVTLLRSVDTNKKVFEELIDEIAQLLAYEVTADLRTEPRTIETPLETMEGVYVDGARIIIVPVLRAGLGMVEGVLRLIPTARVGHIGLQRDDDTLEPADYYFKIPPAAEGSLHIVTDPMLATGGSASAAVSALKKRGARAIRLMCIVAAPEGVRRMREDHPEVPVYAAAFDRALNEKGYILPGLGDAGDRLFGTL